VLGPEDGHLAAHLAQLVARLLQVLADLFLLGLLAEHLLHLFRRQRSPRGIVCSSSLTTSRRGGAAPCTPSSRA